MPHASLLFSGVSNAESRRGWNATATRRARRTAARIWPKQPCPGNYGRRSMPPSPLPLADFSHPPPGQRGQGTVPTAVPELWDSGHFQSPVCLRRGLASASSSQANLFANWDGPGPLTSAWVISAACLRSQAGFGAWDGPPVISRGASCGTQSCCKH